MDKNFDVVTFGNGLGYHLTNQQIVKTIINKLQKYYHLTLFKHFGKCFRVVNTEKDMKDVLKYEYLVNFWIDQPLCYLYLTKYNGISFCFYILKGDKIYASVQRFDQSLFEQDTMFEGYLINNTFLVEDMVIYQGHTIDTNMHLEHRLKTINNILDYKYQPDPVLDTYRVMLKDYTSCNYLKSFLTDYETDLDYKNNIKGIIFSPLGKCIEHLRVCRSKIDIKDAIKNAQGKSTRCDIVYTPKNKPVCFLVKSTDKPDVYHLYLKEGYYDIASVPDKDTSYTLRKLFETANELVMVCSYDDRLHVKRWTPKIVSNRTGPDSVLTLRI